MLKSPYPYFGGKSRIAEKVWNAFGDIENYVEPFAGSLAILLYREKPVKTETVNDMDGFICNFWRAVANDPEAVAKWADWPVSEMDLFARHSWLVNRKERLVWSLEDPDFYDAKMAGWWVWGMAAWIGGGFCWGHGPWVGNGANIIDSRQLPHLSRGQGIKRQLPNLSRGPGINRKLPHLSTGQGILEYILSLSERTRKTRVTCGNWSRVCGPTVTTVHGLTGIFLDPPYQAEDASTVYANNDRTIAADVLKWCIANGSNPMMRIIVCGYEEYNGLESHGWSGERWKAAGGYGNRTVENQNKHRETFWKSPHCLKAST